MRELEDDGFAPLARPHNAYGVYCLVWKGVVVYVGQSKSVYQRIVQHKWAAARAGKRASEKIWKTLGEDEGMGIQFDEVWVKWCAIRDLERLEWIYIDRFKPRWNVQVREPLPEVKNVNIHSLAERMGWKLGLSREETLIRARVL